MKSKLKETRVTANKIAILVAKRIIYNWFIDAKLGSVGERTIASSRQYFMWALYANIREAMIDYAEDPVKMFKLESELSDITDKKAGISGWENLIP